LAPGGVFPEPENAAPSVTCLIVLAPVVRFAILATVADPEAAKRIAYVLTPARADGLAFGALVAILLREPRLRAVIVRHSTAAISAIVFVLLAWFGLKARFISSPRRR